jgi:hypothetical protein
MKFLSVLIVSEKSDAFGGMGAHWDLGGAVEQHSEFGPRGVQGFTGLPHGSKLVF